MGHPQFVKIHQSKTLTGPPKKIGPFSPSLLGLLALVFAIFFHYTVNNMKKRFASAVLLIFCLLVQTSAYALAPAIYRKAAQAQLANTPLHQHREQYVQQQLAKHKLYGLPIISYAEFERANAMQLEKEENFASLMEQLSAFASENPQFPQ